MSFVGYCWHCNGDVYWHAIAEDQSIRVCHSCGSCDCGHASLRRMKAAHSRGFQHFVICDECERRCSSAYQMAVTAGELSHWPYPHRVRRG